MKINNILRTTHLIGPNGKTWRRDGIKHEHEPFGRPTLEIAGNKGTGMKIDSLAAPYKVRQQLENNPLLTAK